MLATVAGDIHEIGKSLAASGFQVFDLGTDVPTAKIVEKATEVNTNIVAMSALPTTTRVKQREVIEALEKAGIRESVKVMAGGGAGDSRMDAKYRRRWLQPGCHRSGRGRRARCRFVNG